MFFAHEARYVKTNLILKKKKNLTYRSRKHIFMLLYNINVKMSRRHNKDGLFQPTNTNSSAQHFNSRPVVCVKKKQQASSGTAQATSKYSLSPSEPHNELKPQNKSSIVWHLAARHGKCGSRRAFMRAASASLGLGPP